jgi:hypothetical protein
MRLLENIRHGGKKHETVLLISLGGVLGANLRFSFAGDRKFLNPASDIRVSSSTLDAFCWIVVRRDRQPWASTARSGSSWVSGFLHNLLTFVVRSPIIIRRTVQQRAGICIT